jgi:glycosyltransferase involved in cell wall biosynthesis
MRIGIVTGEYPPMQGGVGAFSHIIAREFATLGQQVYVCSSVGAQSIDRIPVHTPIRRWNLGALGHIAFWADQYQVDVINLQFQTAAFQMSPWIHFLPAWTSIPVVTTFHDLRFPYLFPKAGRLRDWIVMHLARTSAASIVTNHEDFERVKHLPRSALIPIGSNILTTLPPDFDRDAWRAKAGASNDETLLAYFGFMNHSKGIEPLLDALAQLKRAHVPAKLVLIGGRTGTSDPTNAAYAKHIEQRIAELDLTDAVTWTDFVDDAAVAAYLRAADLVVLPFLDGASYRRGTLMAAIHHACAIITTTPQVTIPAFEHCENMWLVPPNDGAAIAQAVQHLRANPALRDVLQNGALNLRQEFDWTRIAQTTLAVFEQVIHEKSAP